jgi:hypothetical protein
MIDRLTIDVLIDRACAHPMDRLIAVTCEELARVTTRRRIETCDPTRLRVCGRPSIVVDLPPRGAPVHGLPEPRS